MIKYVDLGISEEEYEREISPKLKEIFLSGNFISQSIVEDFEDKFAKYCGSKFAVALNSGTDALIFALKSLGIGDGDEVITVSNSFIATANSIVEVGAKVIFVDIGNDLLIDAQKIEDAITNKTKAIMPVHLMGHVCNMQKIQQIADKYNLEIIEDAAQSIGSRYKDRKTGTFGKVGCFSLHPLKNLSGVTDGGIVITDDEKICNYIKEVRNHGLVDRDTQNIVGRVSRLSSINATILSYRLSKLNLVIARRREVAKIYNELLKEIKNIEIIDVGKDIFHTYHTYIIKAQHRDKLSAYLLDNGVETKIHYPVLIHNQKPFKKQINNLKNTEKLSLEILTLPVANITDKEIEYVAKMIVEFYRES